MNSTAASAQAFGFQFSVQVFDDVIRKGFSNAEDFHNVVNGVKFLFHECISCVSDTPIKTEHIFLIHNKTDPAFAESVVSKSYQIGFAISKIVDFQGFFECEIIQTL
jgi:hypothetical protein